MRLFPTTSSLVRPHNTFRSIDSLSLLRPTNNQKGTVDYIFYGSGVIPEGEACAGTGQESSGGAVGATSPRPGEVSPRLEDGGERSGCLRCLGVAEPPLRRDLDRFGGLPSPEEPSDHILLAARFEVTLRC